MEQYKPCSKCKNLLPFDSFNKKASTKTGLRYECRACQAVARKKYSAHKKPPYSQWTESMKIKNRKNASSWNRNNKAKRTLAMAKRRALQKNNGVYLVTEKEIKKMQAQKCFYCGAIGGEIDHVIPLTRGGSHSIGNLVGCCRSCNSSKNNRFLTEWLKKKRAG